MTEPERRHFDREGAPVTHATLNGLAGRIDRKIADMKRDIGDLQQRYLDIRENAATDTEFNKASFKKMMDLQTRCAEASKRLENWLGALTITVLIAIVVIALSR